MQIIYNGKNLLKNIKLLFTGKLLILLYQNLFQIPTITILFDYYILMAIEINFNQVQQI